MDKDTQLPAEVVEKILRARDALVAGDADEAYHQLYGIAHPKYDTYYPWQDLERQINYPILYEKAINERRQVTEYATKLHQAELEIAQLKRWKAEASELLAQIHSYAHKNMEVKLGQCNVKAVIERCRQFEQAQRVFKKVIDLYDLTPEDELYNEIKTFLDGK